MEDGEGREIDFKNTIILLTSNVGTDTIMKLCADPETRPDPAGAGRGAAARAAQDLQAGLPRAADRRALLPARRRRHAADHRAAARPHPASACTRTTGPSSCYDDALVDEIAGRCTEVESGARNVDHILTRTLLPEMSRRVPAPAWPRGEAISRSTSASATRGSSRTTSPDS